MSSFAVDRELLHRGDPEAAGWGNLGLWDGTRTYGAACVALAAKVGVAAELAPRDRVLDAGIGAGAQIALWRERFGVSALVGIDPVASNLAAARAFAGSATQLVLASAPRFEGVAGVFDRVVSVDCAYHFDTREGFFRAARARLRPGGRLAFSDLVVRASPSPGAALTLAARAASIPRANLIGDAAMRAQLAGAGFDEITFERLDDEVLLGFARFVARHRARHGLHVRPAGWPKLLATAWLAERAVGAGALGYVVVGASAC